MKSWIIKLFFENWIRKLISFIFAIIIWFLVDQSLTTQKTINAVGVRIINTPEGKTISDLQSSGLLSRRYSVHLHGSKSYVEELSASDIEILIDAKDMHKDCAVNLETKHISSLNPELNIARHITKVGSQNIILRVVPLAEEKIPVYVTEPIGEAPKGYQFLDIWPYHLDLTVKGPEEIIKRLKNRGSKLTFNLNDIQKSDLDRLSQDSSNDVVSFFVPKEWKTLEIPALSENPLEMNDPDSKYLRIDFVRSDYVPIEFPIPVNIYVSPKHSSNLNTSAFHIANSSLFKTIKGQKILNEELYTKGVSTRFVKTIRDMLSLSINLLHNSENGDIDWSLQFINPNLLEDRYISTCMADPVDDFTKDMHPRMRQEYLRNRFRNYMNRFQLYTENEKIFNLKIDLRGKEIYIEKEHPDIEQL